MSPFCDPTQLENYCRDLLIQPAASAASLVAPATTSTNVAAPANALPVLLDIAIRGGTNPAVFQTADEARGKAGGKRKRPTKMGPVEPSTKKPATKKRKATVARNGTEGINGGSDDVMEVAPKLTIRIPARK